MIRPLAREGEMDRWSPGSWGKRPGAQLPGYADRVALSDVERTLAGFPPLVFAGEARKLKQALARVAAGEAFLLQGGDCAESFAEHSADNIRDFFSVFPQIAGGVAVAAGPPRGEGGPHPGQVRKPPPPPVGG